MHSNSTVRKTNLLRYSLKYARMGIKVIYDATYVKGWKFKGLKALKFFVSRFAVCI